MIKASRRDQYIYNKIKELEASVNPEVSWGKINGTLSNQADLKTALDNKENLLPDKTGKAGKYLKINTGETGYEWADAGGSFSGTLDDIPDGTTYKRVTQTEKNTWNAKSNFSGSWNDLTDKPSSFNPSSHNHSISEVTNLQTTLDGKASTSHTHTKSNITDFAHQSSHQSGGSDALTGNLDATARVLLKKANVNIGSRRAINFIDGSNVTINVTDDSANEKVDVTISASASGGVTIAQRTLTADETKTNDTSMQGWFNSNNRLLLDANSIYEFEGMFSSLNGSTSHGLNMQFDAISGATIRWTSIGSKVNETTQATATRVLSTNTFDTARNVTTASTVTGNVVWVRGIIVTGASGGYFAPKVAQTATSGSFTAKAGTYMKVRKVGANTDINIGGWTT